METLKLQQGIKRALFLPSMKTSWKWLKHQEYFDILENTLIRLFAKNN